MAAKSPKRKHGDPINLYKSIHQPAKNGDTKYLEVMVKEGASVNELDDSIHKFTPLHWACQAGALECIQWLLWHGADPSVSSTEGWTPLHVSAIRGSGACIQALINNKVNISAMDVRGNTAAHIAATHGHTTSLSTLLRAGIDANEKNKRGWTPVHCSAFHGRLGCLQVLLKWGGKADEVDKSGNNAVHMAASSGHLSCFKFLMGEPHNPSSSSSCYWLSERNNDGETPKMVAERFFKRDIVDYIEQIEWEHEHPEEAQSLAFPAHLAAYTGDMEQLKLLVENNIVNINERDNTGSTPAHKAAGQGNLEILQWLMEFGADVGLRNQAGETPADVARRFSRLAGVKMISGKVGQIEEGESNGSGDELISVKENAKDNARKRLEESERRLEIAKLNYLQLGGRVDDVVTDRDREVLAGQLEELRQKLEEERIRRECLEDTMEDYKDEIIRLTCELQQVLREKEEADALREPPNTKKSSKNGDQAKRRFK